MTDFSLLRNYAFFADGAYVDLSNLVLTDIDSIKTRFNTYDNGRIPLDLSNLIFPDSDWQVVDYDDDENGTTGFATTAYRTTEGKLVFAVRGSENPFSSAVLTDWLSANIMGIGARGVAVTQAVSLFNYIKRAMASSSDVDVFQLEAIYNPVTHEYDLSYNRDGIGTGIIQPGDVGNIDIVGHSLGGHLAIVAKWLFYGYGLFDHAYSYNGANFGSEAQDFFNDVSILLSAEEEFDSVASDYTLIAGDVTRILSESSSPGDDLEIVPGWETGTLMVGNEITIQTEVNSHSIGQLLDALTLQTFLEDIGPNLSRAEINELYSASSNDSGKTDETLISHLYRLFVGTEPVITTTESGSFGPGDFSARSTLYAQFKDLVQKLEELYGEDFTGLQMELLAGKSSSEISALAAAGDSDQSKGYRYALVNLLPFAITSNLAGTAAADSKYDLSNFTQEYLDDRAYLLTNLLAMNTADTDRVETNDEREYFIDRGIPLSFKSDGAWLFEASVCKQYVFDDEDGRTSNGGEKNDRIYGGGGNDVITGEEGADHIEGNANNDQLFGGEGRDILVGGKGNDYLDGGFGDDTLIGGLGYDTLVGGGGYDRYLVDNNDVITIADELVQGCALLNGNLLTGGIRQAADPVGTYISTDGSFIYVLSDTTLTINNSLVINNFQNSGDLGIVLIDTDDTQIDYLSVLNEITNKAISVIDGIEESAIGHILNYGESDIDVTNFVENVVVGSSTRWINKLTDLANTMFDFLNGVVIDFSYQDEDVLIVDTNIGKQFDTLLSGISNIYENYYDQVYDWGNPQRPSIYGDLGGTVLIGGDTRDVIHDFDWFNYLDTNGNLEEGVIDGNDTIYGGANDDFIILTHGDNFADAGSGDDYIDLGGSGYIHSVFDTEEAASHVGSQTVIGGPGNDTYLVNSWYGDPQFIRFGYGDGNDEIQYDTDSTIIEFQDGIEKADVDIRWRTGWEGHFGIDIRIISTGDSIFLRFFNPVLPQIVFSDAVLSSDDIWAIVDVGPTVGLNIDVAGDIDDFPFARLVTSFDDTIISGGSNDSIASEKGDDFIRSGDGDDIISGGFAFNNWSAHADSDEVDDGNDIIDPGEGNDQITFRSGHDELILNEHFGYDTVLASLDNLHANGKELDLSLIIQFVSESVTDENIVIQDIDWSSEDLYFITNEGVLKIEDFFDYIVKENKMFIKGINFSSSSWSEHELIENILHDSFGFNRVGAWIRAQSYDLTLHGGVVNDYIFSGQGNDTLYGGLGGDLLDSYSGNDTLDGGADNDALQGGAGDDVYLFGRGSGSDHISDFDNTGGSSDVIRFAEDVLPSEVQVTRSGDQLCLTILDSGDVVRVENFFSNAKYLVEQVEFYDGTVWDVTVLISLANAPGGDDDKVYGSDSNDMLTGLGGNDWLYGEGGNDTLDGGADNDILQGGAGDDVYLFGRSAGSDYIYENDSTVGNSDVIRFAADVLPGEVQVGQSGNALNLTILDSSDVLSVTNFFSDAQYQIEQVEFNDGTVWNVAALTLLANTPIEGYDTFYGGDSNDMLTGLGGNDWLYGEGGNDTLDGGADNDILQGGAGDDVYLFGRSAGSDYIYENDRTVGNNDVIRFAADVLPFEVQAGFLGYDLRLTILDSGDTLTISNFFIDTRYQVEQVVFNNGMVLDVVTVAAMLSSVTEADDTLYGSATNDMLTGLGGGDLLFGWGGNDTLLGGTDDDTLLGSSGNDSLVGGEGNDTYMFHFGDGFDYLNNTATDSATAVDTIQFGAGILPSNVKVSRVFDPFGSSNSLQLKILSTGEALTLTDFFNGGALGAGAIDAVKFSADTSVTWTAAQLQVLALDGDEAGNFILDSTGNDLATGRGGNDTLLAGWGGNDTLDGGSGNDNLMDTAGNDLLLGGTGNDFLRGGAGNDSLVGGDGNDTYQFNLGDGFDVINNTATDSATAVDTIQFGAGILPGTVKVSRAIDFFGAANNLQLKILSTGEVLTLTDFFNGGTLGAGAIDAVKFTSDTSVTWNAAKLQQLAMEGDELVNFLQDSAGNDLLSGYGGNDLLIATWGGNDTLDGGSGDDFLTDVAGNDLLLGGFGNDMLVGGAGNDSLAGGDGNDTYMFNLSNGFDVVNNSATDSATAIDTIQFGAGILPGNVKVSRAIDFFGAANNVQLKILSTGEVLTLTDFFNGGVLGAGAIDAVKFSADTSVTWNAAKLQQLAMEGDELVNFLQDSTGNDLLSGYGGNDLLITTWGGNDTLDGGSGDDFLTDVAGNDLLLGGFGNDMLVGGAGNDSLAGGDGNDTYMFNLGNGTDRINNNSSDYSTATDTLTLGTGLVYDELWFTQSGNDLVIDAVGTNDRVVVGNWYSSPANELDRITASGQVLYANQVDQLVSAMSAFTRPEGIGAVIPQAVQDQLEPVIAAAWQAA